MALNTKQIHDLNWMNVAAQNVSLGLIISKLIEGASVANLNTKQIYDLNWMNVAAQNAELGTIINKLINGETPNNLTDKQIHDLNWMNVAAQNVQLGTVIDTLIKGSIKTNITLTAGNISTSTGTCILGLSEAIPSLLETDFIVTKNNSPLTITSDYTISNQNTKTISLSFTEGANLVHTDVLTVTFVKDGYIVNNGVPANITNNIPETPVG